MIDALSVAVSHRTSVCSRVFFCALGTCVFPAAPTTCAGVVLAYMRQHRVALSSYAHMPCVSTPPLLPLPTHSAYMLVGAKHKASVGDVESQHTQEVSDLISELAGAGSAALGVQLQPGVVDRLNAYARSVAHFPTAVKEFEWRNGYFWGLSQSAAAEGRPDPCPMHTALLKEVGAV